jgi:hypothetical protein
METILLFVELVLKPFWILVKICCFNLDIVGIAGNLRYQNLMFPVKEF